MFFKKKIQYETDLLVALAKDVDDLQQENELIKQELQKIIQALNHKKKKPPSKTEKKYAVEAD
jgi:hypothetical protein